MSVHIILAYQTSGYNPPIGSLVINSPKECFTHLESIKKASVDSTSSLTVVVRDVRAAKMLEVLRNRPGVEFRESDLLAELSKRWRCSLPNQLTKEAIGILQLFDIAIPPNRDIIGSTLNRAYDTNIFTLSKLDATDEAVLLNLIVRGHPYRDINSSIQDLLMIRLHEWEKRGSIIAKTLANNPNGALWYFVSLVLHNYPLTMKNDIEGALELVFGTRPMINEDILALLLLDTKCLPTAMRLPVERVLRPYLSKLPLSIYLNSVSGVLPIEFEVLSERVVDTPRAIDLTLAKTVFAKLEVPLVTSTFQHIEQHWLAVEALSISIEEIISDKRPDKAFTELAEFYANHYLSVKEVYGSDEHALKQLLKWNEEYAAWLVRNYHRLMVAPTAPFAADQLKNHLQVLLEDEKIPILWVIDGLSWRSFRQLRSSAERAGIFLMGEPKACLAPIPTITEIGMTALISGEPLSAFASKYPNRSNWLTAREKCFQQHYPGSKIGRANNPTQINEILSTQAPIYLLQTSLVDKHVHDHDLDKELFERYLDTYFEVQCQALAKAIDHPHLHKDLHNLVVVVATDHGFTDLLRHGVEQLPPVLNTEPSLVSINEPQHCVIEITLPSEGTHERSILETLLEKDWYILSGEGFNLPKGRVWVVPRKQRRTRGGSLRVHGRPSLEETIVPLAEFTFVRREALELQLAIHGRMIKDTECEVTLQVTNTTELAVRDITIEIPAFEIKSYIPIIHPKATGIVPINVKTQKSGSLKIKAQIASLGAPFQWKEISVQVEQNDAERLLGEDRAAKFFDEEEL